MKIQGPGAEYLRSEQLRQSPRVGGESASKEGAAQPASAVERSDKVQISDAGRRLAAQAGEASAATASPELTPERIAEFRQKILSGAYNSVEVVEQVARKMLASGDI
jgi:negative regulator of flagellin synthesis FlgM